MQEVIGVLDRLFKEADPEGVGFNFTINAFIDPGGAAIQPKPGGGGAW